MFRRTHLSLTNYFAHMDQGKLIVGSLKNMDDLLVTDFNPSLKNLKNVNWDYHSTLERQYKQYLKPNMRNQKKSGYLLFLVGSKIASALHASGETQAMSMANGDRLICLTNQQKSSDNIVHL